MILEWNDKKSASNFRKHDVSFEEATTVFNDPFSAIFDDEDHSELEPREIIMGYSVAMRMVVVSFTQRESRNIRIISARKATRKERKDYEEAKVS